MKYKKIEIWLYNLFGFGALRDLAESIIDDTIERANEDEENESERDIYDYLMEVLDDKLIYYCDQWTILEGYCLPTSANWDEAIEDFINDLMQCIKEVQE